MSRRRKVGPDGQRCLRLNVMCLCGRRLDQLLLEETGQLGSRPLARFLYDDTDVPGRTASWPRGRVKGRPAVDVAEYMSALGQTGTEEYVRTFLCTSCGARPEVSVDPLVQMMSRAWREGHRGAFVP